MKRNSDKSKETKLRKIIERYGKTVHDMVVEYPDSLEITMAMIGKEAGISRESVRLWINDIYGTTKKTKHKPKYAPNIIKECIPELMGYSFEAIRSKLYKIIETGKVILFRQSTWKEIGGEGRYYIALKYPPEPKPDLLIIVIDKNERYVFPPIPGINKFVCLSKKVLSPYLNRFDYIDSDPGEVPIIQAGKGQSKYKGVRKVRDSFQTILNFNGEMFNLGTYETEDVAALVYDKAVLYFCPKKVKTNGLSKEPFDEQELASLIRSCWPKKRNRFIGVL